MDNSSESIASYAVFVKAFNEQGFLRIGKGYCIYYFSEIFTGYRSVSSVKSMENTPVYIKFFRHIVLTPSGFVKALNHKFIKLHIYFSQLKVILTIK